MAADEPLGMRQPHGRADDVPLGTSDIRDDRGRSRALSRLAQELCVLANRRCQDDQIDLASVGERADSAIDRSTGEGVRLNGLAVDADDAARRPSFSNPQRNRTAYETQSDDRNRVERPWTCG
jgi:hypothetical protein